MWPSPSSPREDEPRASASDAAEARNAIAVAEGRRGLGFEVLEALADFADRPAAELAEARKPMLVRLVEAIRRW